MHRAIAALAVAAVALGSLTACGAPVGGDAEKWLLTSEIVDSVDTDGYYDGFTFMPSVTAQLDPTASAAEVRALALDASAYLADRGTLEISLAVDELAIRVARQGALAGDAADLWATARVDGRVASGSFTGTEAALAAPREQIAAVFADYAPGLDLLEVASDESDYPAGFRLSGTAACYEAGAGAAAVLIADASIAAADVDLCATARVVTASADEFLVTAERLAPQLVDAPFAITVVYDDDSNLWFQTAGRELPLARVTPELLSLLRGVAARDPLTMRVEPEGRLVVEVAVSDLRPAVTSILRDPSIAAVPELLVRAERVSVQTRDLAEASSFLDLAEGFLALDLESGYLTAKTGEVRYILVDDELTVTTGKRLVDVALSNEVWRTSSVAIVDYDDKGAVFVNGTTTQSDGEVGQAIADYWDAQA